MCLVIFEWMSDIMLCIQQKRQKQIVLAPRNGHMCHSVRPLLWVVKAASSVVRLDWGFIVAVVNLEYFMDFKFLWWWAALVLREILGAEGFFLLFLLYSQIAVACAYLSHFCPSPAIDCDCSLQSARLVARPMDLGSGSCMHGGFLNSHDPSPILGRSYESGPWE